MSEVRVKVEKIWMDGKGNVMGLIRLPSDFVGNIPPEVSIYSPPFDSEYNESRSFGDASVIRHPIPEEPMYPVDTTNTGENNKIIKRGH